METFIKGSCVKSLASPLPPAELFWWSPCPTPFVSLLLPEQLAGACREQREEPEREREEGELWGKRKTAAKPGDSFNFFEKGNQLTLVKFNILLCGTVDFGNKRDV